MKKQVLLLFAAIAAISCGDATKKQSTESDSTRQETIISGTVSNGSIGLVTLVGADFETDIILEEDGSFNLNTTLPYDGYYNAIFGRTPLPLYLEEGNDLAFDMDLESKEPVDFTGNLGAENNLLAKKKVLSTLNFRELFKKEPEDFLAEINEVNSELKTALEEANISNKNFVDSQEREINYQYASYLNTYEGYYKYLNETEELDLPSDFYAPVESLNMADTLEFRISDGYKQLVQGFIDNKVEAMPKDENKNESIKFMELVDEMYPEGYAKNHLLKGVLGYSLKADKHLDKVYEQFMEIQTDPLIKQQMEDSYLTLSKIMPGKDSPTFDYENYNGGTTSLEDLRGKYVYIDVWATWCMPCLMEIPYLKEVAADYQDKNIEFVGISIDDQKDYEKWKNMVVEKELAGVQLYSGGEAWQSDFVQEYRIQGIPRFIMVDPEGKIFDADTHRPSSSDLRILLDEIL